MQIPILFLIFAVILPLGFYKKESFRRMYAYLKYKRKKFKELKQLVGTKYKSSFDIYRISFKMISQAIYQDLLNYLDNRVVRKSKNVYEVQYYLEGKVYRHLFKVKRGPPVLEDAQDEKGNSIISKFREFITPEGKVCSNLVTPRYLDYEKIKVVSMLKGEQTFSGEESIRFS